MKMSKAISKVFAKIGKVFGIGKKPAAAPAVQALPEVVEAPVAAPVLPTLKLPPPPPPPPTPTPTPMPGVPKPSAPTPSGPTPEQEEIQRKISETAASERRRRSRASTVATTALGLADNPQVRKAKRTLLG